MTRLTRALFLLGLFLLVGCGTDYYADRMIEPGTQSGKLRQSMTGSGESLVNSGKISEHHTALLTDGNTMDYWIIKASPEITAHTDGQAVATILMLHDLGGSKSDLLKLARRMGQLGYDIVLVDMRRHGLTSGQYFTYGAKERDDLRTLMDQLLRDQSVSPKIVAFGEGIGGSVAILYGSYDPNCMGVVAYQPYADLKGALKSQSSFNFLTDDQLQDAIQAGCLKADFEPAEASAALAAMQMRCPIHLIRRKGDINYPAEQTQRIYESANSDKTLEIIDMGSEGWSFLGDPTDYLADQINEFALGGLVTGYYQSELRRRQEDGLMNVPNP
jgi:pimeloyl-ACP methyl ester carboxylesterase